MSTQGRMEWAGRTALAVAALAPLLALGASARSVDRELARPLSLEGASYVRSSACVQCHPGKHASWHRTFHRTMTQEAVPGSVLGAFDGRSLDYGGIRARMERDARGGYAMRFERLGGSGERWTAGVARTVGSRRYQQYLTRQGDSWLRLPVAWNVEEERFMHMNGAFLTPDPESDPALPGVRREDYERHVTRWNDNCVYCHNVAPNPGLDAQGRFDTRVAELGIACEACHGPASAHVARNRDPLRRYALHLAARPDPTIANPRRLSPQRSAQVCGHCHGQRLAPDIEHVHRVGDRFTPGEDLGSYSRPLFRDTTLDGEPGVFEPRFWPDGTPRLTAYEYQGLLQSACTKHGGMTCESCHSMHEGDPRGQLAPSKLGDAACTSCHQELRGAQALQAHAHHRPQGAGARCLDCHMPRVVYGLIGAHRSHRVDSPAPGKTPGRPDACTLCHVDRSVGWASDALARWRGAVTAAVAVAKGGTDAGRSAELAEVPRLLLAGDPIERAMAAAALGRADAGGGASDVASRLRALLDAMRNDRYPAVRSIAFRSARALLTRAAATVPAFDAFTATDGQAARERAVSAIEERLPRALQTAKLSTELAALRSAAPDARIFIGE